MTEQDWIVQPLLGWRVRNFKSVETARVDLSPLTVLVGANSSGKSSLLQSILLVVQGMHDQTGEEHLCLNGTHVELGDFHDVRHAAASARDRIEIGGTFELPSRSPGVRGEGDQRHDTRGGEATIVEWEMGLLNTRRDDLPGRARLREVRFSSRSRHDAVADPGRGSVEFLANVLSRRRLKLRSARHPGRLQPVSRLEGRMTVGGGVPRDRGFRTVGLAHRAGVPVTVFVQGDIHAVLAEKWVRRARHVLRDRRRNPRTAWDRIRESGSGRRPQRSGAQEEIRMNELATAVCDRLIDLIVGVVHAERNADGSGTPAAAELMESLDSARCDAIDRGFWAQLHSLVTDTKFLRAIERRLGAGEPVLLPGEEVDRSRDPSQELATAGAALASLLSDHLVYLGPLRQDPRVLYLAVPTSQPGYVGSKGEYAFAVLHRDANREILCPLADGGAAKMPLGAAVNHWLETFGLADAIETVDRTRLGLQPQLAVSDVERPLDMTAVGVGVSQLVPVLVMGLHATPGTVLLIEQPELHLHPAMQQALADFLLACVRSGRQVIVETHSDHLVTRLRRRIAEDERDEILSLVGLVSVERRDGATRFRKLHTNRYGGFDDWPEGFFDQGSIDVQQLLWAGMRKKKSDQR